MEATRWTGRPGYSIRSMVGLALQRDGPWTFAGSDAERGTAKWRCPSGECLVKSEWVEADRLHSLAPLRVRGLERVRLHADLTIVAQLGSELAKSRSLTSA